MAPLRPSAPAAPPAVRAPFFSVRRSEEGPACYHQLFLEDDRGGIASWVIPLALKKLNKKSALLWLLPTPTPDDSLACVETGPVRQVPSQNGTPPDLRARLAEGTLQLTFSGHCLRGYHRLRCLREGNGQPWQLTPIS